MPEQTNQSCKCAYPCSRHGNCEACMEYHRKDGSRTNCGKDGKTQKPNKKINGSAKNNE